MSKRVTTESINTLIKDFNLMLVEDYNGRSGDDQLFKCNSEYEHEFEKSWNSMRRDYKNGCPTCRKFLNEIKIYQYDLDGNFTKEYKDLNEVPNVSKFLNNTDFKADIRKNAKEVNKTAYGSIYTFIAPIDNKLVRYRDSMNDYSELEQNIMNIFKLSNVKNCSAVNRKLKPASEDKRLINARSIIKIDVSDITNLKLLKEYNHVSEAEADGNKRIIIFKDCNKYKLNSDKVDLSKLRKKIIFAYKDDHQLTLS